MKLGRYHEGPKSSSFLQRSNKMTPRSVQNSVSKNPQLACVDVMKLPSLMTVGGRKAISFTTQRNTRTQLLKMSQKLDSLQSQIHNTRMDAHELLNHIRFLKEELVDKKIAQDSEDLKTQINGLKRLVQITKQAHESRSSDLREGYIQLWNKTEDMRQLVFILQNQIDSIEEAMGSRNV